ncbi:hypothetical protein Ae201684P_005966 [Aphanomyces euteiches]|uniref:Coilin n=1 Tax=Aphanomyces euteiches TaxID=100861 RepID=A0A6G0WWE9_9STRA|nr:hypothetical protein Ae201684_010951 [Aphanomyces euteiches]KAH9058624.1 hypothetical protein Ae201684P_005966 [Aphanomyces euteiches]
MRVRVEFVEELATEMAIEWGFSRVVIPIEESMKIVGDLLHGIIRRFKLGTSKSEFDILLGDFALMPSEKIDLVLEVNDILTIKRTHKMSGEKVRKKTPIGNTVYELEALEMKPRSKRKKEKKLVTPLEPKVVEGSVPVRKDGKQAKQSKNSKKKEEIQTKEEPKKESRSVKKRKRADDSNENKKKQLIKPKRDAIESLASKSNGLHQNALTKPQATKEAGSKSNRSTEIPKSVLSQPDHTLQNSALVSKPQSHSSRNHLRFDTADDTGAKDSRSIDKPMQNAANDKNHTMQENGTLDSRRSNTPLKMQHPKSNNGHTRFVTNELKKYGPQEPQQRVPRASDSRKESQNRGQRNANAAYQNTQTKPAAVVTYVQDNHEHANKLAKKEVWKRPYEVIASIHTKDSTGDENEENDSSFAQYPSSAISNVLPNNIIGFKVMQLCEIRFQPVVSNWMVGKVVSASDQVLQIQSCSYVDNQSKIDWTILDDMTEVSFADIVELRLLDGPSHTSPNEETPTKNTSDSVVEIYSELSLEEQEAQNLLETLRLKKEDLLSKTIAMLE